MKINKSRKALIGVTTALFMTAAAPMALAKQTCFTSFGGTVNTQFDGSKSVLQSLGYHPLTGVTFGALQACAGLSHWGVVGSAYTESASIVMGYRAETADAGNCGAVDFTVNLDPSTMTGTLQLYNERTAFGNTDTLTKSKCATVPPMHAGHTLRQGKDAFGN